MNEISIEDIAQALSDGATVIDVREAREYAEGHVPGVVLIPMGQLPSRIHELDADQPVYVICASGNRSAAMADLLAAAGFQTASVAGGTAAWSRAGRALARA
jgi:rhodanese-related sulfurtransferase